MPHTHRNTPTVSRLVSIRLSGDRRRMRLTYDDGGTTEFTSGRPAGFTDTDLTYARKQLTTRTGQAGQRNYAHQLRVDGRDVLVQVHLGPPTWWRPQAGIDAPEPGVRRARAGWLRVLLAVTVTRRR